MRRASSRRFSMKARAAINKSLIDGTATISIVDRQVFVYSNIVVWGVDQIGCGFLSQDGTKISVQRHWYPLDDDAVRFGKMAVAVMKLSDFSKSHTNV